MKSRLMTAILLVSLSIVNRGYAQWKIVSVNNNDLIYNSVTYISHDTLWAQARQTITNPDHFIITSYDGGNTYKNYTNPLKPVFTLTPLNGRVAFISGQSTTDITRRLILRTRDGGQTWDSVHVADSAPTINQSSIFMIPFNESRLSILYRNSVNYGCLQVYTSDNGGNSWQLVDCGNMHHNLVKLTSGSVLFVQDSFAMIGLDSSFLITNDYGHSWYQRATNDPNMRTYSRIFMDRMNGVGFRYRSASVSTIHYTHDGGVNWDSVPLLFDNIRTGDYARDSSGKGFYFLGGNASSVISYDSGHTWTILDHEKHDLVRFYSTTNGISTNPVSQGGNGVMLFTGIPNGIAQVESEPINLFPNPANEQFFIKQKESNNLEIEVINTLGYSVLTEHFSTTIHEVHTANLDSGLYFVRIRSKDKMQVFKLTIL